MSQAGDTLGAGGRLRSNPIGFPRVLPGALAPPAALAVAMQPPARPHAASWDVQLPGAADAGSGVERRRTRPG